MPRPPAPAAARGTRFHAWVEEHFRERQLDLGDLVDPLADRVPGSIDLDGTAGDDVLLGGFAFGAGPDDLASLKTAFLAGPFASRSPVHVELPFGVTIGGLVVRGRIDAVYRERDGSYLVVDWKTGRSEPDPIQLAIYRVAFAELAGVPIDRVGAAFYTVPTGEVSVPADLPDRAGLDVLLGAPQVAGCSIAAREPTARASWSRRPGPRSARGPAQRRSGRPARRAAARSPRAAGASGR